MSIRILKGDCRDVLATLPDESVHCVVTSPPYYGLRDYGTAKWEGGDVGCDHIKLRHVLEPFKDKCGKCGARRIDAQIGLEPSFTDYIETMRTVFSEVRRVLRKDGTLWLNLGDSYAGGGHGGGGSFESERNWRAGNVGNIGDRKNRIGGTSNRDGLGRVIGLKPKDLCGIPWRLAFALQAPQYLGRITRVEDRVWLAAMVDAEGCMFIHKRKAGANHDSYEKNDGTTSQYIRQRDNYGAGLEVANTSERIVQRCLEIAGKGSICTQEGNRRQKLYRWNLRSNECRDLVQELYPHLVAKQHQARLLIGCPSTGVDAERAHQGLIDLHNGKQTDSDFAAPASMFGQGWFLRSDIIWSKLNPMPESVTDRPTKAHEYLFLMTKGANYYYDAEAIKEDAVYGENRATYAGGTGRLRKANVCSGGLIPSDLGLDRPQTETRNRRTVWEIPTSPFPEAHFATFPPALVEPCILAGCPQKCCAKCGAPWVRDSSVSYENLRESGSGTSFSYGNDGRTSPNRLPLKKKIVETLGFSPSCSCDGHFEEIDGPEDWISRETGERKKLRVYVPNGNSPPPVPGTVLDPFGGAGTTGLVADRLGRNAILIELSPQYAEMAEQRLRDDAGLFAMVAAE